MQQEMVQDLSHEQRWNQHRASVNLESSALPSPASTPAPTPESPHQVDHDTPPAPAAPDSNMSASTGSLTRSALGIDAEDEDVKIAIMALGAMKSLDGSSRAALNGKQTSKSPTRTFSNSSVTSTAMSSPSSTPATDLTQESGTESETGSAHRNSKKHATLADLPADFQFPAVVQDEQGNEMTVDPEMMNDADFLKRVSHLPIVRGTLRAYELGKQSSKVVKYGADFVESSVKTISRPVVSRLGASLGERGVEQLDDFACRQLDRLYPAKLDSPSKEDKRMMLAGLDEKEKNKWQNMGQEEREKRKKAYIALKMEERERELMVAELRQRKGKGKDAEQVASSSADAMDDNDKKEAATQALIRSGDQSLPFKGSKWGSMLVEAGATAGGLSAAMSEESMKSLKYCLQWLQYATAHIEHQITILRDLIVKLNHGELDVSNVAVQNLANIKGDVINTIRGVVDVVGKYAGSALPEPARNSVKAFILSLPARWATINRSSAANPPSRYFGSSPSSPSFSSAHISLGHSSAVQLAAQRPVRVASTPRDQMQAAATAQAANRILTLAVESLDILRSVTIVFGESLDRADLWVERLRILGLQRKRQHEHQSDRIDSSPHWESARGLSGRASSPGAESDATTASTKRRKVKTTMMSRTPSVISDDENLTETEKRSSGRRRRMEM